MALCIQDPTDISSEYLVDTLLDACNGAIRGAGAFAFLSAGGVRLLFQDAAFVEFARTGAFDLVVGVDAITDTSAIAALNLARVVTPSLDALVHLPSHPRSIFHPKLAWFEKPGGGVLVTGSGNLTAGGLRWNIEAFNVANLNTEEVQELAAQWAAYKARCEANLLPTDHPRVVALLERNAERRRVGRRSLPEGAETPLAEVEADVTPEATIEDVNSVDLLPPVIPTSDVLVAEIPKSGDRWKQANFDLANFINFFGASQTVARRAYFFHVRDDGTVGHQEVRPAVVVVSQNYRFELDAASGVAYPANGRPIGVFVRIASRTFIYTLVMPGELAHLAMNQLLTNSVPNPGQRMRRVVFTAAQVQAAWGDSPLWRRLSI